MKGTSFTASFVLSEPKIKPHFRVEGSTATIAEDDRPFLNGSENTLEAYVRDGRVHLSIDNPWAGDSETGFGQTTHMSMSLPIAVQFLDWLLGQMKEA